MRSWQCAFYIDHTLGVLRRYLVENVYSSRANDNLTPAVARITRWVFSIIRASLRLFDIYVHPYRPSLTQLETMFPELDMSVLYVLLEMRDAPKKICIDPSFFASVEAFTEKYSAFILREAGKQKQVQRTETEHAASCNPPPQQEAS